ncbi:MAG: nucleotidyltransferase, partial [Clostridia bacterium]|nr:nucleotidyltransferase [Clostridia bacterium]
VCEVDENSYLLSVTERTHIVKSSDGALYTEDDVNYRLLPENALVSMNMWGFTPSFVQSLEDGFPAFLEKAMAENPLKAEYFLPSVVSGLLDKDAATVQVLPSRDRWYGVTYQEDKPVVMAALRKMGEDGLYPAPLWP